MRLDDIIQNRKQSTLDNGPLDHCHSCDRPLSEDSIYVIAKAFQKGRCLLETVQCLECQATMQTYISEQSLENLHLYKGKRFEQFMADPFSRRMYYIDDPACLVTGEPINSASNFEIYTVHPVPAGVDADEDYFFVGETALEQISELLSEQTRGSWGRFIDQLTPDQPDVVISPSLLR